VAPEFIFYTIARSRGSDVLRRLLGATFDGILGSDRLPTYLTCTAGLRQFWWSHFTKKAALFPLVGHRLAKGFR
jgi:hypothetical protein